MERPHKCALKGRWEDLTPGLREALHPRTGGIIRRVGRTAFDERYTWY